MILTDEQEQLIPKLKKWYYGYNENRPYFSLSGAAGTGKTTVIRYFIEDIGLTLNNVICAAYVGKAVTLLASHGLPAKTIHSLIYKLTFVPELDEDGLKTGKLKMIFALKEQLDCDYKLIVIDEASMVNDELRNDILSFHIPVIFIGDMNQLPPIFGQSSVMIHPDFVLTKIMRQSEGDPIIKLSQDVLHGIPFRIGEYGKSRVISEIEFGYNLLNDYDVILCAKNKTRGMINDFIRCNLLELTNRAPIIGDKIICRQNNWEVSLGDGFFLTNGTSGIIDDIDKSTINAKSCKFDFIPDFTGKSVLNLSMDYRYIQLPIEEQKLYGLSKYNKFEYGYALTTHLSQGSQYPRVLFIDESFYDIDTTKKLRYTAITRAMESITIVTNGRKHNWE